MKDKPPDRRSLGQPRHARRVSCARQRAAWISEQIELADAETARLQVAGDEASASRLLHDIATRLDSILAAQMELDDELDDLSPPHIAR
jgi:hypothetical protein